MKIIAKVQHRAFFAIQSIRSFTHNCVRKPGIIASRHDVKPGQDCRSYICGWSSDVVVPCWYNRFCLSRHSCQDLRSGKTFPWTTTKYDAHSNISVNH